jgi:hypothetical protein
MHGLRCVAPTCPWAPSSTDDESSVLGLEFDFIWQLRVFKKHFGDANALGIPNSNDSRFGNHVITL